MLIIGKVFKYCYLFYILFKICATAKLPISNKESSNANSSNGTEGSSKSNEVYDDMILSPKQHDALFSPSASKRLGLADVFMHWPRGIVPYEIADDLGYMSRQKIKDAISYIHSVSCIRLVERSENDEVGIRYENGPGCMSLVGMNKMPDKESQPVKLHPESCDTGRIIHETMHALGFLHMHTALDRDKYLKIQWDNIKEEAKINFKPYNAHVSMFGTEYDYNSIMHYSSTAFSKDSGKETMVPIYGAPNMGQRDGMSAGDIIRINRMYECPESYIPNWVWDYEK